MLENFEWNNKNKNKNNENENIWTPIICTSCILEQEWLVQFVFLSDHEKTQNQLCENFGRNNKNENKNKKNIWTPNICTACI